MTFVARWFLLSVFTLYSFSSFAANCERQDFGKVKCKGKFTAKSQSELNQYLSELASNPRDLKIDFSPTSGLNVQSPCKIEIDKEVSASGDICLQGSEISFKKESMVSGGDITLISTDKEVKFDKEITISGNSFKVESEKKIQIDKKVVLNITGDIFFKTNGDFKAHKDAIFNGGSLLIDAKKDIKISKDSRIEVGELDIKAGGDVEFDKSLTINVTGNFNLDSADCEITPDNYTFGSRSGSCFAKFNTAPTLPNSLSVSGIEDISLIFDLLSAVDPDNDLISYTLESISVGSISGCLDGSSNKNCSLNLPENFNGNVTISYKISDGFVEVSGGEILAEISPVNDAPSTSGTQNSSGSEDSTQVFTINEGSDVDSVNLSYLIEANPSNGSLECQERNCVYTPNANYNGSDSFTYKISDGELDSNIQTVSIEIIPVNDAPVAGAPQSFEGAEDTPLTFTLNEGSDIDSENLSYQISSTPQNGVLNCNLRTCSYTPNLNFTGSDSFSYKVSDGELESDIVEVSLNITSVNDIPLAGAAQTISGIEDEEITFSLNSGSDIESDESSLIYNIATSTSLGTLSGCLNGTNSKSCTFTPNENVSGVATITYTVSDGEGISSPQTISIEILEVNDPPTALLTLSSLEIDAGDELTMDGSGSSDIDDGIVSYKFEYGDGNSSTSPVNQRTYIYPQAGIYEVKLFVTDAGGLTSSATQTLTVKNVSQGPTFAFNPIGGIINTATPSISIDITDSDGVDYSSLKFTYNDQVIPTSAYSLDEQNGKILLNTESLSFNLYQINRIKIEALDTNGFLGGAGQDYNIVIPPTEDTRGPVINFAPSGGVVAELTPMIEVFVSDTSEIDYFSINAVLDGKTIHSSLISRYPNEGKFVIKLNESFKLKDDSFSTLMVSIRDVLGNETGASLGFDGRAPNLPSGGPGEALVIVGPAVNGPGLTCAILDNGNAKCWNGLDYNSGSASGPYTTGYPSFSLEISFSSPIVQIAAGQDHACALLQSGAVQCFGQNTYGKLGIGPHLGWRNSTVGDNESPDSVPAVPLGGKAKMIAVAKFHTCAVMENNDIRCWGFNASGALGIPGLTANIGENDYPDAYPPIRLADDLPASERIVTDIKMGQLNACVVYNKKHLRCFGQNFYGQLGYGNPSNLFIGDDEHPYTLGDVDFGSDVAEADREIEVLDISERTTCVVLKNNKARCWGNSSSAHHGQFVATIGDDEVPTTYPLLDLPEDVVSVSTGLNHTCFITVGGDIRCFGSNSYYQLGLTDNGTRYVSNSELAKRGGNAVSLITSKHDFAYGYTCATYDNQKMKCWGYNQGYPSTQVGYGNIVGDQRFELPDQSEYLDLGRNLASPIPPVVEPVVFANFTVNPQSGSKPLEISFDASSSLASEEAAISKFIWNFGDGSPEVEFSGLNPQTAHTYAASGVYTPTLTVIDSASISASFSRVINVFEGNNLPVALFSADPVDGFNPLTVNFDASDSFDPNGSITSYKWFYGDGFEGSGITSTHTYILPGTYLARLQVRDNEGGETISDYQEVNVSYNAPPIASLNCKNIAPQTIECSAANSSDPDGTLTNYTYEFSDGTIESGAFLTSTTKTFSNPGDVFVTLIVTDNRGAISSIVDSVVLVPNQAPIANFNCSPNGANKVTCSGSSSSDPDGEIASYTFDMGDGTTLTGETINHEYLLPGDYTVSLSVADIIGATGQTSKVVTIEDNPAPPEGNIACWSFKPLVLECSLSNINDPDGEIISYDISFSDGSSLNLNENLNFTKTLEAEGNIEVTALVTDNEGLTLTSSSTVLVRALPSIEVRLRCTDAGSNKAECELRRFDLPQELISNVNYKFEDNDQANGQDTNASFTFSEAGLKAIQVEIEDINGNSYLGNTTVFLDGDIPEDSEGENISNGEFVLTSPQENTISGLDANLVFQVLNADLADSPISIERNSVSINPSVEVNGNIVMVSGALKNGINKFEITGLDTSGNTIISELTIWSGGNDLVIEVLDENNIKIPNAEVKIFLDKGGYSFTKVADSDGNVTFNNLPDGFELGITGTSGPKFGSKVTRSIDSTETLTLRSPNPASSIDNNDFSQGTDGWDTSNALTEIVSSNLPGEGNDLVIKTFRNGESIVRRTFVHPNQGDTLKLGYKFEAENLNDRFEITIRGVNSGKISRKSGSINSFSGENDFNLEGSISASETFSLSSDFITYKTTSENELIEVEIKLISQVSESSSILNKFINSFAPSAYAQSNVSSTSLTVFDLFASLSGDITVNNFAIIDYVIKQPGNGDPQIFNFSKNIEYLSVGPFGDELSNLSVIEENILIGDIDISLPSGSTYKVLGLQVIQKDRVKRIINLPEGTGDYSFNPDGSFVFSATKGILGSFSNEGDLFDPISPVQIKLVIGAEGTLESADCSQSKLWTCFSYIPNSFINSPFLYPLTRNGTANRYSEDRDDARDPGDIFGDSGREEGAPIAKYIEGGDDWARLFTTQRLAGISEVLGSFSYNDISNINGGFFRPHKNHQDGLGVDARTKTVFRKNKGFNSDTYKEFESFFDKNSNNIEKVILTYNSQKAFVNYIKTRCSPAKMPAIDILRHDIEHNDHFHIQFDPERKTIEGAPELPIIKQEKDLTTNAPGSYQFTLENQANLSTPRWSVYEVNELGLEVLAKGISSQVETDTFRPKLNLHLKRYIVRAVVSSAATLTIGNRDESIQACNEAEVEVNGCGEDVIVEPHPNGNGLVDINSSVSESVYVDTTTTICGDSVITGNAEIYNSLIVDSSGNISGEIDESRIFKSEINGNLETFSLYSENSIVDNSYNASATLRLLYVEISDSILRPSNTGSPEESPLHSLYAVQITESSNVTGNMSIAGGIDFKEIEINDSEIERVPEFVYPVTIESSAISGTNQIINQNFSKTFISNSTLIDSNVFDVANILENSFIQSSGVSNFTYMGNARVVDFSFANGPFDGNRGFMINSVVNGQSGIQEIFGLLNSNITNGSFLTFQIGSYPVITNSTLSNTSIACNEQGSIYGKIYINKFITDRIPEGGCDIIDKSF